nr:penicillin acylase family protein [Paraburkholderia phosphatilytica]
MAAAGVWITMRESLPQLDGTWRLRPQDTPAGLTLSAPVTIERDAQGVPTVRGANRMDVAYATGFAHAQDRFFQMDLLRRVAAGGMSALVGAAALPLDRANRLHRFRARALAALAALPPSQRELLERYAAGVNAGLASLKTKPFEYWLLRTDPAAWHAEDSLLVVYAMYFDLQAGEARRIVSRAALRERVPAALFAFLTPDASHWDAPLDGNVALNRVLPPPPMRPEWLRGAPSDAAALDERAPMDSAVGSNGWAVDAAHSAHGGALLSCDMHLGLSLPNIWYRVSFSWPGANGAAERVTGVSLPGTPLVIAGSNGHVAWGFTNSYGHFIDLIELQRNPSDPLQYHFGAAPADASATPDASAADSWEKATVVHERIDVHGEPSVDLPVVETRWGPEITVGSHVYAYRWVAHDPQAVNVNLQQLEDAGNVADALHIAQTAGIPTQNIMVADASGDIGWTLAGPLPKHDDNDDPQITSASAGDMPVKAIDYHGWNGYLAPDAYPKRIAPASGRLWTANNRTLPPDEAKLVGDAGSDLGARATQIRDDLFALPHASERDLLAVQTDDRALWITPWRRIVLDALDDDAVSGHPQRAAFRRLVTQWNGRADADAVGYRLVRGFYFSMYDAWFGALDAQLSASAGDSPLKPDFAFASSRREAVMESLAKHHAWVPDAFPDWRAFVLARIDHTIDSLPKGVTLDAARWGDHNRAAIAHPFARLIPAWLPWLRDAMSAPHDPLPGDINMPRVQSPAFGASERMDVSPGHEEDGIFEMPGGQSGHPLSPYFLAGHEAWVRGDATPFLPGKTVHRLRLVAASR